MSDLVVIAREDLEKLLKNTVKQCLKEHTVAPKPRLTQAELARAIHVSVRTVQNWMGQGCPFVRRGDVVRFDLQEVLDWMHPKKSEGPNP